MVYKMNESIIMIQAEAINPIQTNVVFWSHDRGTAKLRMKLVRKNGIPQSLPEGTTVPIRLIFKSATAEGGYGKHDYLATIEDRVNGIVSIVLEDNILGYVGKVEGSVYIDFPDDRSLDTAGRFTFYIKRSPIDDSTPELEDYYFNGFSQTIDKIEKILADGKLEIEQKIAESETQIDAKVKDTNDKITKANQDVATLNTNIDKVNNRIDQTNQEIDDLGKLKRMYSNSIDFGGYDYSGNPNIAPNVGFNDFYNNGSQTGYTAKDGVDHIAVTRTADAPPAGKLLNLRTLLPNKTYSLSVDIWADMEVPSGAISCNIRLREGTEVRSVWALINKPVGTNRTTYSVTFTTAANFVTTEESRISLWFNDSAGACTGYLGYNIKIEEGSTATPYQPNLLDAPYYLSKVALGKNIANKDVQFPITTTEYSVYSKANVEDYKVNQKYVVTMKATKPATQSFVAYLDLQGTIKAGNLTPVEGMTDVWQLVFTVTQANIDAGAVRALNIYQYPSATKGAVQIDWLKIEKGDTRTPNISQFKYFGEGLKDSNNPNDYSWDITPEYTEKGLNNTVSLTEPQSVEGLKNFEDGLQIAGKEVATVPEDTGWVNLTAINGHSWNKQGQIRRIGKLVMFRGSLKGSTLSTQDFCTIPEGFRPSNPTDNYEYQFLLPPQSSNTLDNGGMAYIRPNGVCGLPSFRGTVNLFLAPIQYYID
ncbi:MULTISPECIES: BppU family phage baseplate upper protein [Enterococcus]|uniref:BppU family phage baseplate upper protein n=1 Tax=Enterococcus TaxID=1350 RepID=UPI001882DF49|nr:BppU family phage baseplate upper protein [Enterococcus faecium]MBE8861664.1 BppU family phage baseplate upper protein [Enterococcus faecium]HAR2085311.1 BppU family phage baseplate upper protein [Enterococcus faecium]